MKWLLITSLVLLMSCARGPVLHFGDKVQVISGFYKDAKGRVVGTFCFRRNCSYQVRFKDIDVYLDESLLMKIGE
jgi:hypothetical protein